MKDGKTFSGGEQMEEDFKALEFIDGCLRLIDQRMLPAELIYKDCRTSGEVADAIKTMIVRGAPAIGGAAAYGVYLALLESEDNRELFKKLSADLRKARPTAVNLMWAVDRMMQKAEESGYDKEALLNEADTIVKEDREINHRISEIGISVIRRGDTILTHCNAGALATCGWGTALGVIKEAHFKGMGIQVYADETRPLLQGARLTAWELARAGIPTTLIPDSAAATLIKNGKIDAIILGADRITTDGDVANKVGTFPLSVIAKEYGVPFYSVAPTSTIDFSMKEGKDIPIEERNPDEVRKMGEIQLAPADIPVFNPSFDITPHQNITGIITEEGIIYPPFDKNIERIKKEKGL